MLRHVVRLDRKLRRVYVVGRRLHHGTAGLCLVLVGAVMAYHDRRDTRDWLRFTRL